MTGPEPLCDVPSPDHTGPVRLYPCGWRCTTHAPRPRPVANRLA